MSVGYDGNGALSASIESAEYADELAFAAGMLRRLKQTGAIKDFGTRSNILYGYNIRVLAPESHKNELDKFEFAMCIRWPRFQSTKKTVSFVIDYTTLFDDWKRIPIDKMV
jgi:hypothetical protein